jgi:hypothetical protein
MTMVAAEEEEGRYRHRRGRVSIELLGRGYDRRALARLYCAPALWWPTATGSHVFPNIMRLFFFGRTNIVRLLHGVLVSKDMELT